MAGRGLGPLQIWQRTGLEWTGDIPPKRRLHLAGRYGLLVGPDVRIAGGLSLHVALRLEQEKWVTLTRDDQGKVIRAYDCQLSFNFES